jgi:GPH family glycoside/pentoside/hexuronide:cation symporter
MLSPFIFLLFPVALRTIGSVGFVRVGLILAAIASALRFFFPTNLPVLLISLFLSSLGFSSVTMMNHFFILQCVEYGERKTGVRVEGTPAALSNFTSKVGSALASASVGAIMAIGGYVGASSAQPESAILAVRLLYSVIPAAVCVLMLIVLHFFNVEKVLYAGKKGQEV